jgi:hypothetical protein
MVAAWFPHNQACPYQDRHSILACHTHKALSPQLSTPTHQACPRHTRHSRLACHTNRVLFPQPSTQMPLASQRARKKTLFLPAWTWMQ